MKTKRFLVPASLHLLTFIFFIPLLAIPQGVASAKEWPPTKKVISEYFFIERDRKSLILVRGALPPDISGTSFNKIYWSEDAKTFFPLEIKSAHLEQYQIETSEIRQKWTITVDDQKNKGWYTLSYSVNEWEEGNVQKIEARFANETEKPREYQRTYFSCQEIKGFAFPRP